MKEGRRRSIAKALSWRAFGTVATIIIVVLFTGRLIIALGVGVVELISKMGLYYLHERIWARIQWGKK